MEALEIGATFDANRDEIRRIQMEYLEQLRALRVALVQQPSEQQGDSSSIIISSSSNKEVEALRAENAALKLKASKQAYRIQHLVAIVEELFSKTTTA